MFSTRTIIATTLLLASRVWATNHKGIPAAFSSGFQPEYSLQVSYDSTGKVTDGDDLSGKNLSKVPSFTLGESSGINTYAKYIVLMLDLDVNGDPEKVAPQTLHYLRTDFAPTGAAAQIVSDAPPAAEYIGPEATMRGNEGAHRYVFLLYNQPKDGFKLKGVDPKTRMGFDVKAWGKENGLEPAIAGVHFMATPEGDITAADYPGDEPTATDTAPEATASCSKEGPLGNESPTSGETQETTIMEKTITHTQSVTASDCDCSTSTPSSDGGVTLTAVEPIETGAPAAVATYTVTVGGDAGLVYTPESIEAEVGDKVVFDFLSRNHTVTQSTLTSPCISKAGGQDSGFRPNPGNTPGKETWEYVVEDLEPTWWYCAQGNHCTQGMVFAINPGNKFSQFKNNIGGNGSYTAPTGPTPTRSTVKATPIETSGSSAAPGLTAKIGAVLLGVVAAVAWVA